MVHGIMRINGDTEDHQFGLLLLELLQKRHVRGDGSYLDLQVISVLVYFLASFPAVLIQLHRIQLCFPQGVTRSDSRVASVRPAACEVIVQSGPWLLSP